MTTFLKKTTLSKCDLAYTIADDLRRHIVNAHTINLFHGLEFETLNEDEQAMTKDTHEEAQETEQVPKIDKEAPTIFDCKECYDNFVEKNALEKHLELHSTAKNLSLNFHVCRTCDKQVSQTDLKLQCKKCIHFFHKRCTSKKTQEEKSSTWSCHICIPPNNFLPVPISYITNKPRS